MAKYWAAKLVFSSFHPNSHGGARYIFWVIELQELQMVSWRASCVRVHFVEYLEGGSNSYDPPNLHRTEEIRLSECFERFYSAYFPPMALVPQETNTAPTAEIFDGESPSIRQTRCGDSGGSFSYHWLLRFQLSGSNSWMNRILLAEIFKPNMHGENTEKTWWFLPMPVCQNPIHWPFWQGWMLVIRRLLQISATTPTHSGISWTSLSIAYNLELWR